MREHDETCVPLKFDHETFDSKKHLKIGYFDYNHVFECAGVIKKVIQESVEHLKSEGHTLIRIDTEFMKPVPRMFTKGLFAVSGNFMMEVLRGEDPMWTYKLYYYQNKTWLANFFYKLSFRLGGYSEIAKYLDCIDPLSLQQFCGVSNEFGAFKYQLNRYWSELQLDAVVCPIFPLVAPLVGTSLKILHAFSYSFVWNVADYPAGVLPARLVQEGEDIYQGDERDTSVKISKEIMGNSVGLPVSVQVVAKPFEDEKALRVMKILDSHFKFNFSPKLD
jgi:fatty acid amide hydrolase